MNAANGVARARTFLFYKLVFKWANCSPGNSTINEVDFTLLKTFFMGMGILPVCLCTTQVPGEYLVLERGHQTRTGVTDGHEM